MTPVPFTYDLVLAIKALDIGYVLDNGAATGYIHTTDELKDYICDLIDHEFVADGSPALTPKDGDD